MKTITQIKLKKIIGIITLCFGLNYFAVAQCNANFTYTVSSNGVVNFTNTSTGSISPTSQQWHFGDGANTYTTYTASPQMSHTYQYNGTYYVNLSIFDSANSCFDSTSQTISITNVLSCNVNANFSYSAGTGGQINFANLSTGTSISSDPTYTWYFSDGSSSNLQNPSHTYSYNGTYTVSLYVADSSGYCSNATTQTVSISNGNICDLNVNFTYTVEMNGLVLFIDNSTGTDTNLTHYWTFGDGASTFNHTSPSHTYLYNGTYYITYHIGDSTNICNGTYTNTINITNASNAPTCQALFTDSLFGNGMVNFNNQSSGTTVNTIYTWYAFGASGNTSIANPSLTYSANGTYTVSLQITDPSTGCSSSYTNSVTISNLGPLPCPSSVAFHMHQDSLNPQPGIWEISPVYASQVASAIWYWGDGTSTTGMYPSHNYASAGVYDVCVTVISYCGDSSTTCQNDSLYRLAYNVNGSNSMIQVTVVNAATTGIKTAGKEAAQISVYPNPSEGIFVINLAGIDDTKAQINITNILGEVVFNVQEQINNNTLSKSIDLQNMTNGAYFMKVIVGERSYTNKIIINK